MGRAIPILAALWLVLVLASFSVFVFISAEGDGFTRGLNRVAAFFGWELAALATAAVLAVTTLRKAGAKTILTRILGYGPIVLSGIGVLLLVGSIALATLQKPAPDTAPPPGQVTALPAPA